MVDRGPQRLYNASLLAGSCCLGNGLMPSAADRNTASQVQRMTF